MGDTDIERQTEAISKLIEDRLGIRARSLDNQVRRAGRLLPAAIRRDAQFLVQARFMLQNPKLARMNDPTRCDQASRNVTGFLQTIDPKLRRSNRRFSMAAAIALNLLVVMALVVVVLRWRGLA